MRKVTKTIKKVIIFMNDNIPLVKVAMPSRDVLMPSLEEVLYSSMIGEGEAVYEFERSFSKKFALNHVVAVNSGTAALHIAFLLAGVKANSEVITTSMTAEPTNTTILNIGAKPIFADVEASNGNICPDSIKQRISDETKAICVVHYAGYPVDIRAIRKIADEHSIPLIEDCAHALGASVDGKPVGSFGDFAIFSFQAIKHITTVDGGVLVVKNEAQLQEAKQLRWFGLTKGVPRDQVDIVQAGFKYNMNNVTATFGLAQLESVDALLLAHKENGKYFDEMFLDMSGVSPAKIYDNSSGSYWLYTLLSDSADEIQKALAEIGVESSKLHRPNHLHTVFFSDKTHLPNLDRFYSRLLHLPCGWWLKKRDRERIVETVRGAVLK